MKADLERRVHELLDAGHDPAADPQVRSAIEGDGDARAEVTALATLEGWLRDWEVSVPEEDLEPIAQRIEQRLEEPLGSFDATAPPVFDDPDAKVRPFGGERGGAVRSGEYSLDALAGAVDAPAPAQVTGPSPAVRLSAPPRPKPEPKPKPKSPIAPWVAAAAVVALGVLVSVSTFQSADEPAAVSGEAPAAQASPAAPAETGALPGGAYAEEEAAEVEEPEPALEEESAAETADRTPSPSAGGAAEPARAPGARAPAERVAARRARSAPMATAMTSSSAPLAGSANELGASRGGAGGRDVAIERSRPAVRACLGAGSDSAVVMVRFRDGTVRDARVVRPAGNEATNQCVADALRRARVRPEGERGRRTLYYRWREPDPDDD